MTVPTPALNFEDLVIEEEPCDDAGVLDGILKQPKNDSTNTQRDPGKGKNRNRNKSRKNRKTHADADGVPVGGAGVGEGGRSGFLEEGGELHQEAVLQAGFVLMSNIKHSGQRSHPIFFDEISWGPLILVHKMNTHKTIR